MISSPLKDLTLKEKEEVAVKANKFYEAHAEYINKLMNLTLAMYPPDTLKLFAPDLWSGANWRWFINTAMD